jgi:hypothetical protein
MGFVELEVMYFSKAYKLLYGNEYDFEIEDTVWKELLVFLVNTNQKSDWLDYPQEAGSQ